MIISDKLLLESIRQDYFWEDTLPDFLKSSNEDEVIIKIFKEWVLPNIKNQKLPPRLNWLEIGCGDFNKTFNILKILGDSINHSSLSLQVIEPSSIWFNNFNKKYATQLPKKVNVKFMESKLEDFITGNKLCGFDFISIIHVLYEEEVTTAFLKLLDNLISAKKKCIIFISVEAENSDFALIRKELSKAGFAIPKSKHTLLETELKQRQLDFISNETTGKICKLDFNALNNGYNYWLVPFLLGISKRLFNSWKKNNRNLAIEIIQNKITSLNSKKMSINDKTFLIRING